MKLPGRGASNWGSSMPRADIVERLVVERQLKAGMSPTDILVAHYDGWWRRSRRAGRSNMAVEYREARDAVAGVSPRFFIDVAKAVGASLSSVVSLFKDSRVVRFFQKIGWSFARLWKILKEGQSSARKFADIVKDYVRESGAVRWTRDEIYKFDEWLAKPENKRKKMWIGAALGAIFVYLWWLEADTGDAAFDWDISEVTDAVTGNYSISSFLMGPDGVQLMALVAAGIKRRAAWNGR